MLNQRHTNIKHYLQMQCNPEMSHISKLDTHIQLVKSKIGLNTMVEWKYTIA